jgi:hypothetical protein
MSSGSSAPCHRAHGHLPFLLVDWGRGLSFMSDVGNILYRFPAALVIELSQENSDFLRSGDQTTDSLKLHAQPPFGDASHRQNHGRIMAATSAPLQVRPEHAI